MSLTLKRRIFIEEYLKSWNATRAAEAAGYKFPRRAGSFLLSVNDIQQEIEKAIAEKVVSRDEVLLRLGEIARSEHTQYINDQGALNLGRLIDDGKAHLIKEIKETKYGKEIHFYDGQKALVDLGKHLGLFTDRTENLNIDLSNLTNEQLKRIADGESPLDVLANPSESGA